MMPWFGAAPPKLKPMTENSAIDVGIRHQDLLRLPRDAAGVLERGAGRRLHLVDEVARVLFGHERLRHGPVHPVRSAPSATKNSSDDRPAPPHRRAQAPRRRRSCPPVMTRSNQEKNRPLSWLSRSSSSADSAGVSVTALNTESATANAMVIENCA